MESAGTELIVVGYEFAIRIESRRWLDGYYKFARYSIVNIVIVRS